MGWNGMEPNGIEGSEVSCSGMEFYGMASNRIEYNMMEGNGKMGYNETGHFSLWLCSFHLFLSIFALKENIKVSEKTTTRPRLVTSPSILLYTRAWSESKSKPGGLLSVWVCTCMDATRVSENIARNEMMPRCLARSLGLMIQWVVNSRNAFNTLRELSRGLQFFESTENFYGRISGDIGLFVFSKRRRLEALNLFQFLFPLKRPSLRNKRLGVSGPTSFRDFRETTPRITLKDRRHIDLFKGQRHFLKEVPHHTGWYASRGVLPTLVRADIRMDPNYNSNT